MIILAQVPFLCPIQTFGLCHISDIHNTEMYHIQFMKRDFEP